jgi:hypothetical protein
MIADIKCVQSNSLALTRLNLRQTVLDVLVAGPKPAPPSILPEGR